MNKKYYVNEFDNLDGMGKFLDKQLIGMNAEEIINLNTHKKI